MKRGEIYYANLNPTVGSEINKKRPVLIVSNDANNRAADTITVVPITSNTNRIYPFDVLLKAGDAGLPKKSKAQCNQIRTISKLRITKKLIGAVNKKIMEEIEHAVRLHLGF